MLLDASKAFDRVNYEVLINKVLKLGLSDLTLRIILNLYTHQNMHLKWADVLSNSLTAANRVKQGGILSPILSTVYVNALF